MEQHLRQAAVFRNTMRRVSALRVEPKIPLAFTEAETLELARLRQREVEIQAAANARATQPTRMHRVSIEVHALDHQMPDFLAGLAWWMTTAQEPTI